MHRRALLALLDRFAVRFPQDRDRAETIRRFVEAHADCFERSCRDGHVTGSAWIASPDGEQALLILHRKLGAWLQPGGHADGDSDPAAVAGREAMEESGLESLRLIDWWRDGSATPQPFDVDVHRIPARGDDPEHLHLDIRFLLVADPAEQPRASDESDQARWVPRARIGLLNREPSLLRMAERARFLLAASARPGAHPSPNRYDGDTVSVRASIEAKLRAALEPLHLEILDETGNHSVPAGSESHFRLRVVSRAFDGQRLVERHRAVNRVLQAELAGSIHALALETLTPEEWVARGGAVQESPPCLGGDAGSTH